MFADPLYAARALQLGALGHISKSTGRADLMKALRSVLAGKQYLGVSASPETRNGIPPPRVNLSAREYRVMLALVAGKKSGEIAAEMSLNIKTVSTYKRRILDKTGLKTTADLVRYAIDQGLS
jgi:DNA-binding NarL/FixJ family response regulator